jgi:hypothetical protein
MNDFTKVGSRQLTGFSVSRHLNSSRLSRNKEKCFYILFIFCLTVTAEKSLVNFTPIFVLAGMMIFLIPTITEKALGLTFAFVYGKVDGKCPSGQ